MKRFIVTGAIATTMILGAGQGCTTAAGDQESFVKWNRKNNPAYVDANFKYNVAELPLSGTAEDPIPADYWATYHDSINVQWDGDQPSPAAKYAKAFGIDGLEDTVSSYYGIDKYRGNRKSCKTNSDCTDLKDGSSCSRRAGESSDVEGVCIPTWWGMCHGWAPYAISEPAATKSFEYNGVTFYPGDLEALMSLVYGSGLPVKFLSERCNEEDPGLGDDGRIADEECRDMNPGSLHIVATNMLGIRGVGFVEDRTYDLQVWNQPVKGYRVTNATADGKLLEVSKEQALALLETEGSEYIYNDEAKRFFHVELDLDWITEAAPKHTSNVGNPSFTRTDHYSYILETDADGNVFGGEYIGSSRTDHPDFVWWPTGTPRGSVAGGKITYEKVAMLNALASNDGGNGGGNGGGTDSSQCVHSECAEGDKLDASCSSCAGSVCAADSYCCDTAWDDLCTELASQDAACSCGG